MSSIRPLELSVVLATPDTCDTIRTTVSHLRSQTVRDRMELVIVCPSTQGLELNEAEVHGLAAHRIVEVGTIPSVGVANAAGVRHATAPIVALCETHAFPDPTWAAALINAHEGPFAAVGPAVVNANPDSVVSWASFLIAYSQWMPPAESGPVNDLPGHNSSYKRALLLERYGDRLEILLETESILHRDLRRAGHDLYLEASARTRHMNPSLVGSFLAELFHYGRLFAAARAQHWTHPRRLAYTAGAPLIPLVRTWRILPEVRRARRTQRIAAVLSPAIIMGLATASVGEMLGYALGAGAAARRMLDFEFHRERHVTQHDRHVVANLACRSVDREISSRESSAS